MNVAKDLVLHCRAAGGGAVDKPVWAMKTFFNEADSAVTDSLEVSAATSTYTEGTGTIALADIAAGSQTVTIQLTPASHDTDAFYLTSLWFEYERELVA